MSHLFRCGSHINSCTKIRYLSLNAKSLPNLARVNEESKRSPPPTEIKKDMIGPPNQISNLRPVLFYIPENETSIEREFRLERECVQKWNEDFWIQHNSAFLKESQEFRIKNLESASDKEKTSLSAEEMSIFYKAFLDKNWKSHVSYNFQWYRKNLRLLYMSCKVQISKIQFGKFHSLLSK